MWPGFSLKWGFRKEVKGLSVSGLRGVILWTRLWIQVCDPLCFTQFVWDFVWVRLLNGISSSRGWSLISVACLQASTITFQRSVISTTIGIANALLQYSSISVWFKLGFYPLTPTTEIGKMLGSFLHGVVCPYPHTQNREFVSSAWLDMIVWPVSFKVHLAKLHFGVVHLVESSSNLMPRLDGIAAEIS